VDLSAALGRATSVRFGSRLCASASGSCSEAACREQVEAFSGTMPGDRYLFAGIGSGLKEFMFEQIIA
jgi:hypothetical protein